MSGKTENWTNNQITDPAEQFNLGRCYYHGDGVPQDYQQAVYWYRKAAEQGDTDAKQKLRTCRVHAISHTKGLENMWKINWKLVSVLVIIGGLVSVFVYSNTKSAIIFIVALIITAFMADKADTKAKERRKELIKKYYNTYGDRLLQSDELRKKLAKELGHIGPINQRQIDILTFEIRSLKYKE